MNAQLVRKWSLNTKLMPWIQLVIYVSNMLLCAPTAAATIATQPHSMGLAMAMRLRQQQQQQQSDDNYAAAAAAAAAAATRSANAGAVSEEEESYYIALDNGSGSSESFSNSNSNNNNNNLSKLPSSSSSSSISNSLSSTSNINLKPATVFAHHSSSAMGAAPAPNQQQHVATAASLVNSQIFKLLTSSARAAAQQQQQPAAANFSTRPARFYLIESYEIGDDSDSAKPRPAERMQVPRQRRDFNHMGGGGGQQQFQQLQQQHHAQHHGHGHGHGHGRKQLQQQRRNGLAANRNQHRNRNQRKHQQRKRAGRYCSARDPAQLGFVAPTVFAGKIISMTPDRRYNFSATLEVKAVYKQQAGAQLPTYVRLQFQLRNSSSECDIYRERLLARGLVRGDVLEQGVTYMMFVKQEQPGNFSILGQPTRLTNAVVRAVQLAVSENYTQIASIKSITASNSTMEAGKELRITCKVDGRPPPKVTWFKDGKSINRKGNAYRFKHNKKRSELIIRNFNSSDQGKYECRAKNKVRANIESRRIQINAYPVATRPDPTRNSHFPCPHEYTDFCIHDGICSFIQDLNQAYCICPEGYFGERCDSKVNSLPNSRYNNSPECDNKTYYGGYYC